MKIGFLLGNVQFGGGEKVLHTLIREFSALGHEIIVFSWNVDWEKERQTFSHQVTLLSNPPVGIIGKCKAVWSLYRALCTSRPDCLIVFSLALAEVGVFSAKFASVPIVLSERVDPNYLPQSTVHRTLKKIAFSMSSKVVFQTEQVRRFFSKKIQNKGVVIPNMIMSDDLPVTNPDEVRRVIVAAGRLSEEKNYPLLINAFASAALDGYILRIFGDGPLRSELESLISSLNMQDRITLEGNVKNLLSHFVHADIFAITSSHEGMPNVLLEAMSVGLACVSADFPSGGASALIQHNINGVLVEVGNESDLKSAFERLANDTSFKNVLRKNALNILETNSKKMIIPQWISVVESVV